MPSIERIEAYIAEFEVTPKLDSEDYRSWVECQDVVPFLEGLAGGDVPVLVSTPYVYLYAMLVPLDLLVGDSRNDLKDWNFNPSRGWEFWVSGGRGEPIVGIVDKPINFTGSTILDAGEPAVYLRNFAARTPRSYPDPNQKILHVARAHWMQDRTTYCRLNEHGDLVDVIKTTEIPGGHLCTIEDESLDRYMFGTDQALIHLFDFGRTRHRDGSRFHHPDLQEESVPIEGGNVVAELTLDRTPERVEEGRIRGFSVFRELQCRPRLMKLFGGTKEGRVPFIINDWKHATVRLYPGERVTPEGTPVEEDWPELISPAFFRPEVMAKYRADPEKYTVTDMTIECRGSWFLRSYDVNEEGQVHVYLKDLWDLPHSEQLYWKSFNEEPRDGIAQRAIERDFRLRWSDGFDPLRDLKQRLTSFPTATHHGTAVPIWSPGTVDVDAMFDPLHLVLTESRKEWRDQIVELNKVVVEGLQESSIRAAARSLGCDHPEFRSIRLLRACLESSGVDSDTVAAICEPLATLNGLRSRSGGAHRGSSGPTAYLKVHYENLTAEVANSVKLLAEQIESGTLNVP
jgi:hypothetical protein